ncbi:hypothetical protein M2272_005758 [Mycobacterium frederiksbergense]|uniref:Uncharacterized protein n=1 Tax=Mycolicibacterium frederiksbergense TaxID=117567 RepID=A0ABT6L809_9MYCO|nr:hypothetical protein [Mycolicibacterium frederiksbergense]MDH6199091.1 hypothetical protein [Mycolicibacterium frederiksbergense]
MTYIHDDQARQEAADHPLANHHLQEIRGLIAAKRNELGEGGVRAHRVGYNPASWAGLLPDRLTENDCVSRGDVFAIAETGDLADVFTASYVWGTGRIGYGPRRYRDIVESTAGQLDLMLARAAEASSEHPVAGYAMFYGGDSPESRAPANHEPWCRIEGFGPAFFTKFLYFTTPGALILDNVLARKVAALSGMPHLVTRAGKSRAWSPYRYAVYLHWMRQAAQELGCSADELELTLFTAPDLST